MHDLLTEWCHDAYLLGMRQGYALAKILKSGKGKLPQKAKAKIAQVLMENPKATNEEVCNALDKARIELYKSKSMPKDAAFWWEVAKVRYYRNLINRVGKQVAKATRLDDWQDMIWMFNSDGMKPGAILDLDPF